MLKHLEKLYDIEYNGHTGRFYGILLADYPQFSGGSKNYDTTAVQGRLGQLVGLDNYVENLTVECTFSVIGNVLMQRIRELKRWLSGTGELRFSDYPETFFKVWKIDYKNIDRQLRHFGQLTVRFVCTPFWYLENGKQPISGSILFNEADTARPVYKILGNGTCTLTVNGKSMTATVGQNLTIDTEKMLAYREDGELQNTGVTGDYEDIYLLHGENEVSISDGFSLSVIPNWGYEF